jgi:hypothetical protein
VKGGFSGGRISRGVVSGREQAGDGDGADAEQHQAVEPQRCHQAGLTNLRTRDRE